MSKQSIIGMVVWLVTLLGPFNMAFLTLGQPGMATLVWFVLTLVGMSVGAIYVSKGSAKKSA